MIGRVVRCVTSMWPRSDAERFADRLWPDRPTPTEVSVEPLVGDDSFHYCASDAMPATDARPAGASVPQPTPPAGQPNVGVWQLTAAEMKLLGVRPGDYIGSTVVGAPIEKTTPLLSRDDLEKASLVIRRVSTGWPVFGDEHGELLELAERLSAAAYPQTGP